MSQNSENNKPHEHEFFESCDGEFHTEICNCGYIGKTTNCPDAGTYPETAPETALDALADGFPYDSMYMDEWPYD